MGEPERRKWKQKQLVCRWTVRRWTVRRRRLLQCRWVVLRLIVDHADSCCNKKTTANRRLLGKSKKSRILRSNPSIWKRTASFWILLLLLSISAYRYLILPIKRRK